MSAQHTPGPYQMVASLGAVAVYALEKGGRGRERNRMYAQVQGGPDTPADELVATAQLFAAAPTLLALLKRADHAVDELHAQGIACPSCANDPDVCGNTDMLVRHAYALGRTRAIGEVALMAIEDHYGTPVFTPGAIVRATLALPVDANGSPVGDRA